MAFVAVGRGLIVLLVVLTAWEARAEHEANHRYLILGYVKDARGQPLHGVAVRVTRVKTGLSYEETSDQKGFYTIIVHLHDEDLGDQLQVSAQTVSVIHTAQFNQQDARTERGTRLDFVGTRIEERRSWILGTLRQYLSR